MTNEKKIEGGINPVPQSTFPLNPTEGTIISHDGSSQAKGAYQYLDGLWVPMATGVGTTPIPNNWFADPEGLDETNVTLLDVGTQVVASIPDTVFENATNLYEITGDSVSGGQSFEIVVPAQAFITQPLDPASRGYIDIDLDISDLPKSSGGDIRQVSAIAEQRDSSDVVLVSKAINKSGIDTRLNGGNINTNTLSLRQYFKPHASLDNIRIQVTITYIGT